VQREREPQSGDRGLTSFAIVCTPAMGTRGREQKERRVAGGGVTPDPNIKRTVPEGSLQLGTERGKRYGGKIPLRRRKEGGGQAWLEKEAVRWEGRCMTIPQGKKEGMGVVLDKGKPNLEVVNWRLRELKET